MSAEPRDIDALAGAAPLCLFGAGGHGRVVAAQIARRAPGTALCFGDTARAAEVDGIAVRFHDVTQAAGHAIVITVGDNAARGRLQQAAQAAGLSLARVVIDAARYFTAPPGPGAQVLAGAVVNPGARIGAGVIVNSNAVAEHDTQIGDFCHMAPGSVAGGGAVLGAGTLLGTNATVLPGIRVAAGCVIGAGAVVCRDLETPGTYAGAPARPLSDTKRSLA